jgi:hypothetical protein
MMRQVLIYLAALEEDNIPVPEEHLNALLVAV